MSAHSPSPVPLKTAANALLKAAGVFIAGNILLYLLLYPPDLTFSVESVNEPAVMVEAATAVSIPQPTTVVVNENPQPQAETINVNGDWQRENGVITQRTLDVRDYLTSTGMRAENYTVSVEITLPNAVDVPEAGAGLVIHMQQRDSFAQSQLIRLHQNGQEILWGWYDALGNFQYEGSQVLTPSASQTRLLTLVVRQNRADIWVDNTVVVADYAMQSTNGWIGLMTYRGGVSFTNFRLVVGVTP